MDVLLNLKKKDIMYLLQISSDRAIRMLESGEIPAFKIDKGWHIPVAEFTKWLENNCKQQARVQGYIFKLNFSFPQIFPSNLRLIQDKTGRNRLINKITC